MKNAIYYFSRNLHLKTFLVFVFLAMFLLSLNVQAKTPLNDDQVTACTVVLCLATSATRPQACIPPIQKFLAIQLKTPWKTLTARKNFLKLCPSVTASQVAKISTSAAIQYDDLPNTIEEINAELATLREELTYTQSINDNYTSYLTTTLTERINALENKLESLTNADCNKKGEICK